MNSSYINLTKLKIMLTQKYQVKHSVIRVSRIYENNLELSAL